MVVRDRLAAVLAVGVLVVPVLRHRARAGRARRARRRPRTASGASERSSARIGPPSSWNTPIVSPAAQQVERLGVVERDVVDVGARTRWSRSMRSSAISMTSRLRRPRKSIFRRPRSSTPCISYCVTIGDVLDRRRPARACAGSGRYSVSGSRVITTAAAWMPSWRRRPFEAAGDVDDAAWRRDRRRRACAARSPSCSRRRTSSCCSKHACSGVSRPMMSGGMSLAILSPTDVRVAEHARGVAHRGPGLDRGERDDLRDVVVAVASARRTGSSRRGSGSRSPCRCRASACGPG